MSYTFRPARPDEAEAVYALYQSVIGTLFCTWNTAYPGREEVARDLSCRCLYVLAEDGQIIGALSVVPENELDHLPCWSDVPGAPGSPGAHREIARVVIARPRQGMGLAGQMVDAISALLAAEGCSAIRLSVAKINLPAAATYRKAGFRTVGEAILYGGAYLLMEKRLNPNP